MQSLDLRCGEYQTQTMVALSLADIILITVLNPAPYYEHEKFVTIINEIIDFWTLAVVLFLFQATFRRLGSTSVRRYKADLVGPNLYS
jgi:hypothetical protein